MAKCSQDVSDALWAQIEPIVFMSKERFVAGLEDWDIEPVWITPEGVPSHDGQLAFVSLTQGPELHYTSFGSHRVTRGLIRGWMAPLLERYGYVTTRTPKGERRQQRLNVLLGGKITHEDEFFTHFRLDQTCR